MLDETTLDYQLLFSLDLFKGLNIKKDRHFLDKAEHILLSKGDILLDPRIPNNNLYIVLVGLLSVHLDSPASDMIASIHIGESAGEMSLFDEEIPSAYVVAAMDSRLLKMTDDVVWKMIDDCEGFAKNFIHLASKRIRASNRTIANSRRIQHYYEMRANIDSLTRVYNRHWIDKYLKRETEACIADSIPSSIMLIDIDFFKKYNDDNGHLAGDSCLKHVANIIRQNIRPSDLLGRFGGEEFIILLPDSDGKNSGKIGERIRKAIKKSDILDFNLNKLPSITVSIGISMANSGNLYEDVFNNADKALYKAKNAGRDCICLDG